MSAVHPLIEGILRSASPYPALDLRHQSEEDKAAEFQDWKDERLAYWHKRYLEEGDLADALASVDKGMEIGVAIFKAAKAFQEGMVHRLIMEVMDKAAAEYAAVKVVQEEIFEERMKQEGVALIRARQRGKVPAGYDD